MKLRYQSGFGNTFSTEAVKGALPVGQNSPQKTPKGLYPEVISGTAFTAPRAENQSSWLYKLRPSAMHAPYRRMAQGLRALGPVRRGRDAAQSAALGSAADSLQADRFPRWPRHHRRLGRRRIAIGHRGARLPRQPPMKDRYFYCADGELMFVPQQGAIELFTELGRLEVAPGEIAVVPRGVKFKVLVEGAARGYVCENYGAIFRLPELGPIGAQGLAQVRDFLAPVAAFEDKSGKCEVVAKFLGGLWTAEFRHSPLDVVAWHGDYTPYKYDLARFMAVNTVTFDHADPSIFTVLTSPSGQPGVANCDFVIFPPRWMVAEHTFRPPWFHRNVMSELMGLIHGVYDGKAEGFLPGGISIHNCMSAHGPDLATYEKASTAELKPHKIQDTLAFMWESRYVFRPTKAALGAPQLQKNYDKVWVGF